MENKLKKFRLNSNKYKYQQDIVRELERKGINITKAYYSMIETGKRRPNPNIMKALSEIFETTIEELFFNNKTNTTLSYSNDQKSA